IIRDINECIKEIASGQCILIFDGKRFAFSFGVQKFEKRAIQEPPTSTVIKGPREGFVESLTVNLSLLRRRIKSEKLVVENYTVGKTSCTPLSIVYISNAVDKKLLKQIRDKIKKIDIEWVLDSSYVSKYLSEHKTALFKQIGNTEKPDILASKILEGRIAIFVDGSPIVLTVPYLLIEDFQSPSDYYNSTYSATFTRLIRTFAVILSLLLPSVFVASELFHLQLIPLSFLLTLVNSIKGIPLSPSYEMFFTLFIFEILNEASVRMPKYVGMVVSIVGGLVLGETAVNAGIISAPTLMIVAFSGICLYTVPELVQNFSIIRLLLLAVAGSFGLYALIATLAILIVYLVTLVSFVTPLCAPYSPIVVNVLKDGVVIGFITDQKQLPLS
ncbi:MAG: spore germination protein, partial [Firmicutes bacterium]|nr:spore germination protein [Candidatus Caballimonas caccae]